MCKRILNRFRERKNKKKSEEEIAKAKEAAHEKMQHLYAAINKLSEDTVTLYDRVEDYFFQDIDFQMFKGVLPLWIADAGRSPECAMSRIDYDKYRRIYNDSISNRVIHWYDVQNIISALQDRISATERYLREIFHVIPAYCLYSDSEYSGAIRDLGYSSDQLHAKINNVFVSLSSAFDLFTKIVYECANYSPNGFSTYTRLKSRKNSILYKKINYGFDELKQSGLLYDEPACIRTICSFRDEFIHCGSWDYRCAIYYPHIDGEPVEAFILMPDVEPSGILVSSGSRNKFYATGAKINTLLPDLVAEVVKVLSKTEEKLKEVLVSKTNPVPDNDKEKNAVAYMKALDEYLIRLRETNKTKIQRKLIYIWSWFCNHILCG